VQNFIKLSDAAVRELACSQKQKKTT